MHDPQTLLSHDADAVTSLARRRYHLDAATLADLVRNRATSIRTRDALRAEINKASKRLGPQAGETDDAATAAQGIRELKERLRKVEAEQRESDASLTDLLLTIPNLPFDDVPDGGPEDPPVEVLRWGTQPVFDFAPRDHVELGTRMGILDFKRAAKLSGGRFAVLRGAGAVLERALASFLLDLHTREHGYVEHSVPHLVTRETMTATGQLPKFAGDLFATRVAERELFLIPTAEVPLVNLYRDETLAPDQLPIALTAHTPCYRSEAGSYGRDTRGMIRVHQFDKVELVRLCAPEDAAAQFRLMVSHAQGCLKRLGLHFRTIQLRAGDLGFSARRTYDIEVWLPSENTYREISSVSDCGTFQARRANIRLRRPREKTYVATLNGSGLPLGRTIVALLEQCQRQDGSVAIPAALVPYTGFSVISAEGRPEG
jgi:seryl-tRNA synthetase